MRVGRCAENWMADYVTLDLVNCNYLQYACVMQYEGVFDDHGGVWHWCDTQQSMFLYRHWCDTLHFTTRNCLVT